MGLRFRKSINIGGLKLNISKSGIGYSFGMPGVRYTKTSTGRTRKTYSIPKTGISYVQESKKNNNNIFINIFNGLILLVVIGYVILSIFDKNLLEHIIKYFENLF